MAGVVFQELLELSLLIGDTRKGTQRIRTRHNLVHSFIRGSESRTSLVQEVSVRSIQVSNMYLHV